MQYIGSPKSYMLAKGKKPFPASDPYIHDQSLILSSEKLCFIHHALRATINFS